MRLRNAAYLYVLYIVYNMYEKWNRIKCGYYLHIYIFYMNIFDVPSYLWCNELIVGVFQTC